MRYKAIFDQKGNRITTYVVGIHDNIPIDAIEITEEEQNLYATNEYIRVDGKPQKKPQHVPSTEECLIYTDAIYQPQFVALSQALGMATLAENADLITSIKADYAALKIEYNTKRGEIVGS